MMAGTAPLGHEFAADEHVPESNPIVSTRRPLKGPKKQNSKPFVAPETITHTCAESDTLHYILIHYATSKALVKKCNPQLPIDFSSHPLPPTLKVPWPSDGSIISAPCQSCSSHPWCVAIGSAAASNSAVSSKILLSQDALKDVVLKRIKTMFKSGRSYVRIKSDLEKKYGKEFVTSIKSDIQRILKVASEDFDRRMSGASESECSEKPYQSDSSSVPEAPFYSTAFSGSALFSGTESDSGAVTPEPLEKEEDQLPEYSEFDIPTLKAELQNWEIELKKLDAENEKEQALAKMLQSKIDGILAELRKIPGALLGPTSSGFLQSFDDKFGYLRAKASSATKGERACACCGRVLTPGAPVPPGCAYREVIGTTLIEEEPEPVVSSKLVRPSDSDFRISEEEDAIFGL